MRGGHRWGQIELSVTGLIRDAGAANGIRAATFPVKCIIAPLPAGSYVVKAVPATQFTLSSGADGGTRTLPVVAS